jgi:hypothetical protein
MVFLPILLVEPYGRNHTKGKIEIFPLSQRISPKAETSIPTYVKGLFKLPTGHLHLVSKFALLAKHKTTT